MRSVFKAAGWTWRRIMTRGDDVTTAGGEFWTVAQPDRPIGGVLTAELGEPVEVDLDAVLFAR